MLGENRKITKKEMDESVERLSKSSNLSKKEAKSFLEGLGKPSLVNSDESNFDGKTGVDAIGVGSSDSSVKKS